MRRGPRFGILFLLTAAYASAGVVDISNQYYATVNTGDSVVLNFGIWDAAEVAVAAGYSPYPYSIGFMLEVTAPPNSGNVDALLQLRSEDGSIVVPATPITLSMQATTFGANGGPTESIGSFFMPALVLGSASTQLFGPADFTPLNDSAAQWVLTNIGDSFTIGVGGYYDSTFTIGGCCIAEAIAVDATPQVLVQAVTRVPFC